MQSRPRILLLDTSPPGSLGSMARYGDLVVKCLLLGGNTSSFEVIRLRLALPQAMLRRIPITLRSLVHHAWIWMNARLRSAGANADLVHVLDGSHAYVAGPFGKLPLVATSHDVIPLKQLHGEFGPERPGWLARRVIKASVRGLVNSVHIIADSDSTRRDLARLTAQNENRMSVVQIPVDPDLENSGDYGSDDKFPQILPDSPFILHVGNDAFYKNRTGVLRIFGLVRKRYDAHLVMAGAPPSDQLQELVKELGLEGYVQFLSKVDDAVISRCYDSAAMLLFPSIYEGYGWPPLEAMAHDCPVVCSNTASLPEVVGDAALMAAYDDEQQLAAHCLDVLQDSGLAASMVKKGRLRIENITLEKMAFGISRVYGKALGLAIDTTEDTCDHWVSETAQKQQKDGEGLGA